MGLAHSRTQTIITDISTIIFVLGPSPATEDDPKLFYPPNQFKFSKVQRLKLTVIQAALTPKELSDDITIEGDQENSIYAASLKRIPSNCSFDITDPQESFMATISTLIASLNFAASTPQILEDFNKNLLELIKLFTTVFIKNINIKGLVDIFEFQVDEKVISEHLLTSYINFISVAVNEEILRSFLILISANLNTSESTQSKYFHLFLTQRLSSDHLSSLFDVLISLTCRFNYKSVGFIGSVPIISEKSCLASQILVSLFLTNQSQSDFFQVLKRSDDLKSFALFIKFQSQILQNSFPQHLNLKDLTILTILNYSLTNFCSNYRRFVLSKLDNEELVIRLR